ncbi:hypothetical protein PQQ87_08320 [Paraburkholderia nemoris]|uniref:hypothetical protein n=1 Tax=Paraburkholderia nemoris TaxID=2793076 RepID=UPI0038BA932C
MNGLPPPLKDEIARKTYDALAFLCTGLDHGKLTKDQFSTGMDVVFLITAGLVPSDVIDAVTESQSTLAGHKTVERRSFVNRDMIMTFKRVAGEPKVTVTQWLAGVNHNETTREFLTSAEAAHFMKTVGDRLSRKGFSEL